ncbi:MAG: ADP-ribose pyrophosphatase [Deltaproteobacteria bacterium RBG_19FT_COMBO_43_11]|nr:MAG: ADP-ribose pyrophosphatase [Deltaproteobacteria bacterium RBG_16_44_11]OGP90662.1 MAG: ADP-ribose pyrophosphatase [Deltaproteobacteria bacterium RBG_19FT_COMBO_43_11]
MAKIKYCLHCGEELSVKNINGKTYLACSSNNREYVHWDNPIPVVAAIVEHQGNIILARNKKWSPRMFGLITGFLEKGESPEKAIIREVKEELNLDARLEIMIGVYPYPEQNQLFIVYHMTADGEIRIGEELAEVISSPPEKLRPWPLGTGLAVKEWLEKRGLKAS